MSAYNISILMLQKIIQEKLRIRLTKDKFMFKILYVCKIIKYYDNSAEKELLYEYKETVCRKKKGFDIEAEELKSDLVENLGLSGLTRCSCYKPL